MPCRLGGRWAGFIGGYHLEQRPNIILMLEARTGCTGVAVLSPLLDIVSCLEPDLVQGLVDIQLS
jgi:hypothetical protein